MERNLCEYCTRYHCCMGSMMCTKLVRVENEGKSKVYHMNYPAKVRAGEGEWECIPELTNLGAFLVRIGELVLD